MSHVLEILSLFEKHHSWMPQASDTELLATWGHGKAQRKAMKKWQKKTDKDLKKLGIHDPDD
jgi:hypothetical protein